MRFLNDLKILYHMALKPIQGDTHAQRLESFYSAQAQAYDDFRKRLLKGRQTLFNQLELPEGGVMVDLGAGTGSNLEFLGDRIRQLAKVYLVDLSGSLLEIARQRIAHHGWDNVETVETDATTFMPPEGHADLVTCSYSLTMIPDWYLAVDQARQMLRRGGQLGVVDFYVARKYPPMGWARHEWLTRAFWPVWFANDNVFLSPDHAPYLHTHFDPVSFTEHRGRIPYLPGSRVPYYLFVGRKK